MTEQKPRKVDHTRGNTILSILMASLPLMFLAGLWTGYQVWGKPNVQAAVNEGTAATQRFDIPINDDDPVLGDEDAPVTIVEFSDYECPYCQRYHIETMGQILEAYGDQVRYVFKDLPLDSIHVNAVPAAISAHCANEQDVFWDYQDLLFSNELGLNEDAYESYADRLGLDLSSFKRCLNDGRYAQTVLSDISILTNIQAPLSTPTFFINGLYVAGAQPFSVFSEMIEAELAGG